MMDEAKQVESERAMLQFLSEALVHSGGRLFLKRFFTAFWFLECLPSATPHEASYKEGRRTAGCFLFEYLFAADPQRLNDLLKEMGNEYHTTTTTIHDE